MIHIVYVIDAADTVVHHLIIKNYSFWNFNSNSLSRITEYVAYSYVHDSNYNYNTELNCPCSVEGSEKKTMKYVHGYACLLLNVRLEKWIQWKAIYGYADCTYGI